MGWQRTEEAPRLYLNVLVHFFARNWKTNATHCRPRILMGRWRRRYKRRCLPVGFPAKRTILCRVDCSELGNKPSCRAEIDSVGIVHLRFGDAILVTSEKRFRKDIHQKAVPDEIQWQ